MFDSIPLSPPDIILRLMMEFRHDERPGKVDLGVGVYKDENGQTPVMKAVKAAERELHERQTSKSYVGPAGDPEFALAMNDVVFGVGYNKARIRGIQTPGGSGAIRTLSDLLYAVNPKGTTWLPDPTWPNHKLLLTEARHTLATYAYYDAESHSINFDALLDSLKSAKAGDAVLIHGCCHNPTGADLNLEQWQTLATYCADNDLLPFIDLAYQGFAKGLEDDAAGTRIMAATVPEMVVAYSCSKNFSMYRDRVGAAFIVAANPSAADKALARLTTCVRMNYSMPPDHGASVATLILQDDNLKSDWVTELSGMQQRIQAKRIALADALRRRSNSEQFDYIAHQYGMFSRLPLSEDQVSKLRTEDAIYIIPDGRMNFAGLPETGLDELAAKLIEVM